ncbi:hypothetical protein [Gynurincola endophyticus]|uniref:hypothetical protein n=1 Tax=Gynurincola endophyticus TaxID=2479004 RepID=UPI000F8C4DEB|nr:hypothetical protein [Gynurincola endophyticus]
MKFNKINLNNISSLICELSINEEGSILCMKVCGNYRYGSEGNDDGICIYSLLVSHYFVYEPISVIIDLRELKYSWGNYILKVLNFFNEIGRDEEERNKINIIVYSSQNEKSIRDILKMVTYGRSLLYDNYEDAVKRGIKNIDDYLND